jgi:hypothetical protein
MLVFCLVIALAFGYGISNAAANSSFQVDRLEPAASHAVLNGSG